MCIDDSDPDDNRIEVFSYDHCDNVIIVGLSLFF